VSRFLLAGGGTAGHVNPLLATASRLRSEGDECVVLGTREGLESTLVPAADFPILYLAKVPFPRKPNLKAIKFPAQFLRQVQVTRRILREQRIDLVVGFGGYVAAPAYLAAWLSRVPLVIHEANALPGFANILGSRLTRYVATSFSQTKLPHAVQTGLPLRQEIEDAIGRLDKQQTRVELGLDPLQPTLLVMGGSLGAKSINDATEDARPLLQAAGVQVYHILGARGDRAPSEHAGYKSVSYAQNMHTLIAAADLAVARSGASTVSEFAAFGLPAIFVPYSVGNGEQALNAKSVVDAGGAIVVPDDQFSVETFRNLVIPTISNRKSLQAMQRGAESVGISHGTERLVRLIRDALTKVDSR
jgi:UDP-N-acetylglucosamine--N-acetylmuramyl-(pentapeptide) pyrophosphoryl-undecaprenol N-acetylglucosamine transferase